MMRSFTILLLALIASFAFSLIPPRPVAAALSPSVRCSGTPNPAVKGNPVTLTATYASFFYPPTFSWFESTQGVKNGNPVTYTANTTNPAIPNVLTVLVTAKNILGQTASRFCSVNITQSGGGGGGTTSPPEITYFTGNNNTVVQLTAGQPLTLRWKTTNTSKCTATGAWGGVPDQAAIGNPNEASALFNALSVQSPPYLFYLTCKNSAGQTTPAKQVSVTVSQAPPPAPTVDIKANGSNGPISIAYNTDATLTWTSTNATSCTASGGWSGSKPTNNTTGESTGVLTASKTFTLACGTATDSVVVNVNPPPVSITCAGSITPTNPLEVTWTATVTNPPAGTLTYAWSGTDFEHPITTTTPEIKKIYTSAGSKTATVKVGEVTSPPCSVEVTASSPPTSKISLIGVKVIYSYPGKYEILAAQGVNVRIYQDNALIKVEATNQNGYASFQGIKAGNYIIKADKLGFKTAEKTVTVKEDSGVLTDLRLTARQPITVPSLRVNVKDSANKPISDASVGVSGESESGKTVQIFGFTDSSGSI
ncbi:hypothetical protein HYZ64_02405, partial [Candidatus Berkelbacteria bacterium]|nr:hypothetical protein [Candidatus Berkelbacteria bacterium]